MPVYRTIARRWSIGQANNVLVFPGIGLGVVVAAAILFSPQELETATRLGLPLTHIIMRDNAYATPRPTSRRRPRLIGVGRE